VDPVIGCSTAGAQHFFYYIDAEEYTEFMAEAREEKYTAAQIAAYLEDFTIMPTNNNGLLFNRYKTDVAIQGLYKAYFYAAQIKNSNSNALAPVIFNEAQNIPNVRVSSEEYGYCGNQSTGPFGWNNVSIKIPGVIGANSNIWLGMVASGIGIKFDYGATFFDIISNFGSNSARTAINNGQHLGSILTRCGEYIPDYLEYAPGGNDEITAEFRPSVYYLRSNGHPKKPGNYNFKLSYYIQSVSTAYTRTLTAGVNLADSRKGVYNAIRKTEETVSGSGTAGCAGQYVRTTEDVSAVTGEPNRAVFYERLQEDVGLVIGEVGRMLAVVIKLFSVTSIRDYVIGRFLKSREELVLKSKVSREIEIESRIR
jgi:hypothetical protein